MNLYFGGWLGFSEARFLFQWAYHWTKLNVKKSKKKRKKAKRVAE